MANHSLSALMAQGVSPRDVPKDERSKQENKYNDLAVGDRIKFSLQELGMKCPNAEIKSLKLVLVAAVASGIGDVWEADFARAPPLSCVLRRCAMHRSTTRMGIRGIG